MSHFSSSLCNWWIPFSLCVLPTSLQKVLYQSSQHQVSTASGVNIVIDRQPHHILEKLNSNKNTQLHPRSNIKHGTKDGWYVIPFSCLPLRRGSHRANFVYFCVWCPLKLTISPQSNFCVTKSRIYVMAVPEESFSLARSVRRNNSLNSELHNKVSKELRIRLAC